jgi:hypothetical protein
MYRVSGSIRFQVSVSKVQGSRFRGSRVSASTRLSALQAALLCSPTLHLSRFNVFNLWTFER